MSRSTHPALPYIRNLYAPEDALLTEIRNTLEKKNFDWQVGSEEARILQLLIAMNNIKTIVEVGTLAGYSTIWMARALPEDGHIYTLNKDAEHIALAKDFFARSDVAHKITMLEGDAHATLQTLASKAPFDMLFIDADKISYPDYLDWGEKHIRKGGLIVADNTLLFNAVLADNCPDGTAPTTWKAMRSVNERLADKSRYDGTMIPTEQGLSVAIKLF